MSRIYWDTMLFVYLLENNPDFVGQVQRIHSRMSARGDRLVTSSFTLGELLVAPFKTGDEPLAEAVKAFLDGPAVDLVQFDSPAAEVYASIRATSEIRPPDAIHLACASRFKTDIFITNDKNLHGLVVPGIQFITGLEVATSLLGA